MSNGVNDGITWVPLPAVLAWTDEDWSPVAQSDARTITGALVLQVALRVGGRPITLQTVGDGALLTYATLAQLRAWAAVPGQALTLTLRGVDYPVLLRHQDKAIESTPWSPYEDVQAGDYYSATLRFMVTE